MKNYDDIIHLLHPVSQIHPQMPMYKRAAQFLPFSALTGYHDSIQEAARLIEQKRELNEDQIHNIRQNLNYLHDVFKLNPRISLTYFQKDSQKEGGDYLSIIDQVIQLDEYKQYIILKCGKKIKFDDIYYIDIFEE